MNKFKKIAGVVVSLVIIVAVVLYLMPWGEAESELKQLEITEVSQKVASETGVELNDISELLGVYSTYDMDSATSELMFSIDALQGTVGKFKKFKVVFAAAENLSDSKITVDIDVSSVYTANRMRDKELLEPGFFETVKFPSIRFESSSLELKDTNYVASGNIEMMGVTKEISFPFIYKGKSINYKGREVAIFEGRFTLNRTEYGMEHTTSVGDDVSVNFAVQLEKTDE